RQPARAGAGPAAAGPPGGRGLEKPGQGPHLMAAGRGPRCGALTPLNLVHLPRWQEHLAAGLGLSLEPMDCGGPRVMPVKNASGRLFMALVGGAILSACSPSASTAVPPVEPAVGTAMLPVAAQAVATPP